MIEKIGHTLYKGVSIYKNGGGGGKGPIFEIPNEFEQVDSIYLNYNQSYVYGQGSGNYNLSLNRLADTSLGIGVSTDEIFRVRFWLRAEDNIGGNVNWIFSIKSTFTPYMQYTSDVMVSALIQTTNLNIINGGSTTSINRTSVLHSGINEIVINKGVCTVNGHDFNINYAFRNNGYYLYAIPQKQNGSSIDGTNLDDPSLSIVSIEIFKQDGTLISATLPVRRKIDGRIGMLETSGPNFLRNNNNDALSIKTFT